MSTFVRHYMVMVAANGNTRNEEPPVLVDLERLPYLPALEIQQRTLECIVSQKLSHVLVLVEHPPVLTLGANFHEENLLFSRSEYEARGIEILPTGRGGDVTYHGPGQLVIYPIFNLAEFGKDLHRWLRDLEEAIIVALRHFQIQGIRAPDVNTGVWVNEKKIAAIGIKVRKWVSMHGIALNCNNDMRPFEYIVPCGIKGHGVTSLSEVAGREIGVEEAKPVIAEAFKEVFKLEFQQLTPAELQGVIRYT